MLDALNKGDKAEIKDAIGDIYVTLVMVCGTYGVELDDCVNGAYEEIKDRKGYLNELGNFIKEEDV